MGSSVDSHGPAEAWNVVMNELNDGVDQQLQPLHSMADSWSLGFGSVCLPLQLRQIRGQPWRTSNFRWQYLQGLFDDKRAAKFVSGGDLEDSGTKR